MSKEMEEYATERQRVEKTSTLAVYMGPDKGPFRCGRCKFFVRPRACSKVKGDIDPFGCCNLFQEKK